MNNKLYTCHLVESNSTKIKVLLQKQKLNTNIINIKYNFIQ